MIADPEPGRVLVTSTLTDRPYLFGSQIRDPTFKSESQDIVDPNENADTEHRRRSME